MVAARRRCSRSRRRNAMRIVLAIWFLAHGLAHLPGFIVAWQLRAFPSLPFHTTVLADSIDIGKFGMRVLGLAWLSVPLRLPFWLWLRWLSPDGGKIQLTWSLGFRWCCAFSAGHT